MKRLTILVAAFALLGVTPSNVEIAKAEGLSSSYQQTINTQSIDSNISVGGGFRAC